MTLLSFFSNNASQRAALGLLAIELKEKVDRISSTFIELQQNKTTKDNLDFYDKIRHCLANNNQLLEKFNTLFYAPLPVSNLKNIQKIKNKFPNSEKFETVAAILSQLDKSSPEVVSHFLGQVFHETGKLLYRRELASGKAYEYRKDLGNTKQGDGTRYKGAGGLQLTGRANYQKFSDSINDTKVMEGAAYVADRYFWESAVFYWNSQRLSILAQSVSETSVRAVTKRINGGFNGYTERRKYTEEFYQLLRES